MRIFPGRYTAAYDDDFVIYAFGMRINKPLRVRTWWKAMRTTYTMRQYLRAHPERGNLGFRVALLYGGLAVITFWRSVEDVQEFARNPELHLEAWTWFNRAVRETGEVGMWHEMYKVASGEYEVIYGNMPRVGLADFGTHRPIGSTSETSSQRIGARADKHSTAGVTSSERVAETSLFVELAQGAIAGVVLIWVWFFLEGRGR
jgi:hypothetical protein